MGIDPLLVLVTSSWFYTNGAKIFPNSQSIRQPTKTKDYHGNQKSSANIGKNIKSKCTNGDNFYQENQDKKQCHNSEHSANSYDGNYAKHHIDENLES